jgi:hypothetical protein
MLQGIISDLFVLTVLLSVIDIRLISASVCLLLLYPEGVGLLIPSRQTMGMGICF